jgi:hypothetical protein
MSLGQGLSRSVSSPASPAQPAPDDRAQRSAAQRTSAPHRNAPPSSPLLSPVPFHYIKATATLFVCGPFNTQNVVVVTYPDTAPVQRQNHYIRFLPPSGQQSSTGLFTRCAYSLCPRPRRQPPQTPSASISGDLIFFFPFPLFAGFPWFECPRYTNPSTKQNLPCYQRRRTTFRLPPIIALRALPGRFVFAQIRSSVLSGSSLTVCRHSLPFCFPAPGALAAARLSSRGPAP